VVYDLKLFERLALEGVKCPERAYTVFLIAHPLSLWQRVEISIYKNNLPCPR
jgi:hypothetical protein